MDARDFVRMQYERRLREGLEDTSVHSQTIGSFERFTKVSGCFMLLSGSSSLLLFLFWPNSYNFPLICLEGIWSSRDGEAGLEGW